MKNKVAEMFAVMVRFPNAGKFFENGWNALYNDLMADPIEAISRGERGDFLNTLCGMALLDWYESEEGL